jgi:hypothetical protein
MRVHLLTLVLLLALAADGWAATDADSPVMDVDGAWFSCEFAHSQIPPNDGCKMLDDDGFMVQGGKIDHIKVVDSDERGCRHQRLGQCFQRDRKKITVSSDELGPIWATTEGFAITYWGCTQDYTMVQRVGFYEIAPIGRRCLWAKEKRYFVSRYRGLLVVEK